MPQNEPNKHHYIPQLYLSWWAGDDRRFERYDRPIPSKIMTKRVFPSEAGWMKDLYASPGDGLGTQWLESEIFQVIDSRAAPALRKMNAEPAQYLSAEERSAWTLFLRSLFHRTPENLRGTVAHATALLDDSIEDSRKRYADLRASNDPDTFEAFKAIMTTEERRRIVLRSLPTLMANPRLGQFLHNMPTRVFTLPNEARDFLLSDDPLARTNGLQKEHGHIAIPISPRKLFVSAYRNELLDHMASMRPNELVGNMNTWTVESARYFVVARDRSQDKFIKNHFGKNLKSPLLKVSVS